MLFEVIVVFICLILNAFLALFEMAFVIVSKPEVKQLAKSGHARAEKLLRLRDNPERTLSVLQIGIVVVGALSAAVGGSGAKETLVPALMQNWQLSEFTAEVLAILLVVLPLTFFTVILGELVPKSIALRYPMKIALAGAKWLSLSEKILNPVIKVLESSTLLVLNVFFPRLKKFSQVEAESDSVSIANLSGTHQQFVVNLVHIETKRMRDILVPWSQVNCVQDTDSLNQVLSVVIKSGHTRLPVVSSGKVIGLLHSKEFLIFVSSGDENWKKIIRPLITIGPSDRILKTLRTMQEMKSHMALVMQSEEILGVVTLEDIIEEIVGDISDEDEDGKLKKILAARSLQKTNPSR